MKLVLILFLVLGWVAFIGGCIFFVVEQRNPDSSSVLKEVNDQNIYALVQEYRSSVGKTQYIWSDTLCYIAAKRVFDIQNDWSHGGMDKLTKEDLSRFPEALTLGENIAKGYNSASELVNGWLNSPGHKANLDKPFTHTCIRCNKNYCVQTFGNL